MKSQSKRPFQPLLCHRLSYFIDLDSIENVHSLTALIWDSWILLLFCNRFRLFFFLVIPVKFTRRLYFIAIFSKNMNWIQQTYTKRVMRCFTLFILPLSSLRLTLSAICTQFSSSFVIHQRRCRRRSRPVYIMNASVRSSFSFYLE